MIISALPRRPGRSTDPHRGMQRSSCCGWLRTRTAGNRGEIAKAVSGCPRARASFTGCASTTGWFQLWFNLPARLKMSHLLSRLAGSELPSVRRHYCDWAWSVGEVMVPRRAFDCKWRVATRTDAEYVCEVPATAIPWRLRSKVAGQCADLRHRGSVFEAGTRW